MKVMFAVVSLGFVLVGCEQKNVGEELASGTPAPAGAWMWDKGRGNPLEQPPRK